MRIVLRVLGALFVGLMLAGLGFWCCQRDARLAFLPGGGPAAWIVYPTPADGEALDPVELSTEFRRAFIWEQNTHPARLRVRALKACRVRLNGRELGPLIHAPSNWKVGSEFEVGDLLKGGTNELAVTVINTNGLPALWLSLTGRGVALVSDANWDASCVGASWRPAREASEPMPIAKGNRLYGGESAWQCFLAWLPQYVIWGVLGAGLAGGWTWLRRRRGTSGGTEPAGPKSKSAASTRAAEPSRKSFPALTLAMGALVLVWVALWWNNVQSLPRRSGFDAVEHLKYIQYVMDKRALPLANEGWEMYQPPLYYALAAGELATLHSSTLQPDGIRALRFFGMACGLGTVLCIVLSLRLLFPERPRVHFFGLVLMGFLPANLYLCHYVTNEVLATTLVSATLYLCLRIVTDAKAGVVLHGWLGLALGAALLTKASALILLPIILFTLGWNLRVKGIRSPMKWVTFLGVTLVVCLGVSGWHYWRITSQFGNPLLGNWDPQSGFQWWQQPGYRTAGAYWHFGEALRRPFYSGLSSFGDGLYSTLWGDSFYGGATNIRERPPWNYDLMAAGEILALIPTVAILVGLAVYLVRWRRQPRAEGLMLLAVALGVGLAVVIYSLQVPSYACAKAFYASAAWLPLAVFGACGLDWLSGRTRVGYWLVGAAFGVWALNALATFWIPREAAYTRILAARTLATDHQDEPAAEVLGSVLQRDPGSVAALELLAAETAQRGNLAEGRRLAEQAVTLSPNDADGHLTLARILSRQNQTESALDEGRRALELAPDHPSAAGSLFGWLYQSGKKQEALAVGRESLRVNPVSPEIHYGVGLVLAEQGESTNALFHFRMAAALKREWAEAHDRLGLELARCGQPVEATAEFALAAQLKPKSDAFHYHLAVSLANTGQNAAAAKEFRAALEIHPRLAPALNELAWLLATDSNPAGRNGPEAIRLAQQACELTEWKLAECMKTLAAAYAEAGRFDEAVATLQRASSVTPPGKEQEEEARLMELFKAKKAYRAP